MIKVSKGRIPKAKKVVLYGPEGIGKSTFASQFPDPVFVDTEGSTAAMDVARIEPLSWTELLSDIREIVNGNVDVPCKTIVIDTADWAEKMCADHVCAQNRWDSISSPGYGTGYRVAWEEFGKLLNLLSEATDKGFNVVITAHAAMRKFEQPDEAGSYDRWELKLQNSPKSNICAIVKEWGDMVLFANYKTIVTDKDKQGKGKGKGGRRVMYTEHHPCWDAKNRYGLPAEMLDRQAGAFVSIHEHGELRGCIGTIGPTRSCVAEEIIGNAVSASTRDPRFPAVRADELPWLEINVDVLGEPEDIDSEDQLDVRRYGVIVSAGRKRGLLLPDLDGVDSVRQQVDIAMKKGGISKHERYRLQRFEVIRHY